MSTTEIGRSTTNILNCYFQNKFTFWHIRLNIYKWKTKFTSNKQCFPGHLFLRNAKKTHTDQSILQAFLICCKINVSRTFKSSSCKKLFSKLVYHWHNLFRWIFFIQTVSFTQIVTQRLGATAMLLRSFKQVFWKKSVFYVRCLNNNITMMLIAKIQNKASTS